MEVLRSIKIVAEIDTNKSTDAFTFDDYFTAAKFLFSKLSDDQRLGLFSGYCKSCGCDNPDCQCWNDE